MKISVIIPTYRRADFLGRAVQSVLSQDWPDLEVVVSDDNGPDSPHRAQAISVLEKIHDERVRIVLPDRHLGGSGARNAGIGAAEGDLITFLDDDDVYLPHKLSRQAEFMARGFDTVVCPWDGHENIRSLAADAKKLGAYGILLTTWHHLPNWLRDASFAAGCVWGEGEENPPHPDTECAYLLRTLYDTEGDYASSGWNMNEVPQ